MTIKWIPPSFAGHTSCVRPMSQNWSRRLLQVLCLRSSLHRGRLRPGDTHWLPEACNNSGTGPRLGHHIAVHCCFCQVSNGPTLQSSEKSHLLDGALGVWRAHSWSLTWRCSYSPIFVEALKPPKVDFLSFLCPNSGPNDFATFSTACGLGIFRCLCDHVPSSATEHLVSGASVSTKSLLLVPLFVTSHHSW